MLKRLTTSLFLSLVALPTLMWADTAQKQLDYINTLYNIEQAPLVSSLTSADSVAHLKEAETFPLTEEELANVNEAEKKASSTKSSPQKKATKPTPAKKSSKNHKSKAKAKSKSTKRYSYVVRGKRYYVVSSASIKGFKQTGWASWYGPGFHGKKTASGERFNQNAMTAAHKTLPLGTYVYVKNLSNGRQIKVRINDRGPFAKGRIIDLSKAAAKKLGLLHRGHGKVVITVIKR